MGLRLVVKPLHYAPAFGAPTACGMRQKRVRVCMNDAAWAEAGKTGAKRCPMCVKKKPA